MRIFLFLLLANILYGQSTVTLRPSGDGYSTTWATSSGTTHYTLINESTIDNDATYVVNGGTDMFTLPASGLSGSDVISSVQVVTFARRSGPSSFTYTPKIRIDGINFSGTGYTAFTTSYASYSHTWTTNPRTGSAWVASDLSALQVGVNLAIDIGFIRMTQLYVIVTYTPGAPSTQNAVFFSNY